MYPLSRYRFLIKIPPSLSKDMSINIAVKCEKYVI